MKVPKGATAPHPNDVLKGKLKNAAKMYEQQFLQTMVKAMRSTVSHSEMTKPSMAENIYKDQLDQKYVESWSNNGGTGFADMIYDDLVDKYFPHLKEVSKGKPRRPKELTSRFAGVVRTPKNTEGSPANDDKAAKSYLLALKASDKPSPLSLPWGGQVEKEFQLPDGKEVIQVSHDLGLKSTFVFEGRGLSGLMNKSLKVGENFAQLAPGARSLIWKLDGEDQEKPVQGGTEAEF